MFYVELYSTREDQLRLLERIEKACSKKEHEAHVAFFNILKMKIRGGTYVSASMGRMQVYGYSMYPNTAHDLHFVAAGDDDPISLTEFFNRKKKEADERCDEMKKSHEMEMARMEAQYKSEIEELSRQLQSYEGTKPELKAEKTEQGKAEASDHEIRITISELAELVKARFSKSGAEEVCTMLYHLAMEHGPIDEKTFKLIDDIVPAILKRDSKQTQIDVNTVHQMNVNPQQVNNYTKDGKG